MDYGRLLKRTWDVTWGNKWLFVAGLVMVIGSWGLGSLGGLAYDPQTAFNQAYYDLPSGVTPSEMQAMVPAFATIYYTIMVICIPVGLVVFAFSRVGVGALISGAGRAETGSERLFAEAWGVGWNRGWRLFAVALLFSLPNLLIALLNALLSNQMGMVDPTDPAAASMMMGQSLLSLSLSCLSIIIGVPITLWMILSEQAVVRENKKLFESMGHAWKVFLAHPGEAIVLTLIQYGISIALGLVIGVPAAIVIFLTIMVPCLIPLLCVALLAFIVLALFIQTLTYVYWTLAYGDWLAEEPPALPPAEAEPVEA